MTDENKAQQMGFNHRQLGMAQGASSLCQDHPQELVLLSGLRLGGGHWFSRSGQF